jgi:hypothetical protein
VINVPSFHNSFFFALLFHPLSLSEIALSIFLVGTAEKAPQATNPLPACHSPVQILNFSGFCIAKTAQALMVGIYDDKIQAGNCNTVLTFRFTSLSNPY